MFEIFDLPGILESPCLEVCFDLSIWRYVVVQGVWMWWHTK